MNLQLQRRLDRRLGSPVCRVLSWLDRRPVPAAGELRVKKILVILLSEMGSLVQAHPMFVRLREKYPQAEIYVLLFARNREALEVQEVVPPSNIMAISDDTLPRFAVDTWRAVARLRRLHLDVVVDCELFARISSILAFFSGAPIRVGFHRYTQEGLYRGDFINRPVLYNPYQHISRQFVALAEAIESTTMPKLKQSVELPDRKPPRLRFDTRELEAMRARLAGDFPAAGKKLVLIYPGGGILPIRAWPLEHYGRLSEGLLGRGYAVGVIGMQNDRELALQIRKFCREHPACLELTGYTRTLRELLLLFNLAALLVTNDGGPGQFSVLAPIPTIVLFGPETPLLYGPRDDKAVIFYASLACSPCLTAYNHRNSPCDGDNLCLKCIPPEEVLAKALEILEAKGTEEAETKTELAGEGGYF